MSSSSVETGHETAVRIVRLIEQRVQKDEGNRGLDSLLHSSTNELYNAARSLLLKSNIAIITGFPCLIDYSPPTETDGPLGAVAIADLLLKLGKYVHILTDECNEEPVLSCVSQSGIFNVSQPHKKDQPSRLSLQSFPARTEFDEKDAERLSDVLDLLDCVVAIERVGPASDGNCYTMRGLNMNHLAAPLELLLIDPPSDDNESPMQNPSSSVPNTSVPLVVPASVLAMESAAQSSAPDQCSEKHITEAERAKLLALLESDVELTDEQFEALANLAPPLEVKDEEEEELASETRTDEVEVKFEEVSHDYSNSGSMSMEEMMAQLPPPPTQSTSTTNGATVEEVSRDGGVVYNTNITSIGIGDGGNEVGMGKILALVESSQIPNAAQIACVIPTDHLHVASVSNWGGYALVAAAVTILIHESDDIADEAKKISHRRQSNVVKDSDNMLTMNVNSIIDSLNPMTDIPPVTSILSKDVLNSVSDKEDFLRKQFLPSRDQQLRSCQGLIDSGARDGVTKECALSVDGMPLETSLQVLDEINDIVVASLSSL